MFAVTAIVLVVGGTAEATDPNGFRALSAKQLQAIMPKLTDERAATFLKLLNDAMKEFEINTLQRQAAFLAQVAHESGELRHMEEMISSAAVDGRKDFGSTKLGDGGRYKGRGPLQLTGRASYRAAGQALKLDLENQPELVAKPEIGCRVSAWFWKIGGLNQLADQGDFRGISLRINGSSNGLEQRQKYYRKAKEVLGAKS
jgi:putative chitinase